MTIASKSRRTVLMTGAAIAGAVFTAGASGLFTPARAQSFAPTPTMRGGANNYRPGAPLVERIGGGGFWTAGTVRRAGDGAPLAGVRIQVWAHTTEGHERDLASHGATLTDADGAFRIEMPQIVPAFGQPHGHLAYDAEYDDNGFKTVFLRPVMPSASDTSLSVDFVLEPA
ncbi:MAG: twin-arginine translocation pathway signal [Pseudomonadota bacterium]